MLADAVQADRDAVGATPIGHPNRVGFLNNLGASLLGLYVSTGDADALSDAVQACRDAVAGTPADHPARAMCLSNLGAALERLSVSMEALDESTKAIATLEEAMHAFRDAVAATPAGHPDRAAHLTTLGNALQELPARTKETTATLLEAGRCFRQASEDAAAPAAVRFEAYRALAGLPGHAGGSPQDALAAVEAAIELLPQISSRALSRADREYSLSRLATLAGEAAAAAVTAGRNERAVELLEQTRGVLVADILDARSSDLTQLRRHSSALADAFDNLRARIDVLDRPNLAAAQPTDILGGKQDLAQARRDAYADWDRLIDRIRAIDGFETFLYPPGISRLALNARGGAVVFVYASLSRCDALILTDDPATPVRLVPLTELTVVDANRQTGRLRAAVEIARDLDADPATRIAAQVEILDVLAWMWDTLTGPVLSALGHTTTPAEGEPWPRVWWCPVGGVAYLPLHAAGHHHDLMAGRPHPRTVLDRVVSSYTTTVRGLAYSRAQYPDPAAATTLIIAVPDAPGAPSLPGVTAETNALAELIPGAHVLSHPTRDTVLAALPSYLIAHFACHGYADWSNPAASQLILYDHEATPLTVADISARHLTGGLAYLSACNTTITNPALTNEAVHITGAFHLAGYQHVIGTLWRINDTTACDLAQDFYDRLTHHGTASPDTSVAAHALHHAIRRLRDQYPAAPTIWAAHTHTGP